MFLPAMDEVEGGGQMRRGAGEERAIRHDVWGVGSLAGRGSYWSKEMGEYQVSASHSDVGAWLQSRKECECGENGHSEM